MVPEATLWSCSSSARMTRRSVTSSAAVSGSSAAASNRVTLAIAAPSSAARLSSRLPLDCHSAARSVPFSGFLGSPIGLVFSSASDSSESLSEPKSAASASFATRAGCWWRIRAHILAASGASASWGIRPWSGAPRRDGSDGVHRAKEIGEHAEPIRAVHGSTSTSCGAWARPARSDVRGRIESALGETIRPLRPLMIAVASRVPTACSGTSCTNMGAARRMPTATAGWRSQRAATLRSARRACVRRPGRAGHREQRCHGHIAGPRGLRRAALAAGSACDDRRRGRCGGGRAVETSSGMTRPSRRLL
jgi:hypothetical protein